VVLACLGVGSILWLALSELNPDWFAYQAMYESEGAWLAAQGRDPVFLLIMTASSAIFGSSGYEDFRIALSLYFLFFTALLAAGKILPVIDSRYVPYALALAIMSFGFTRFSIQIREGLATTLLLIGLAYIARADTTTSAMSRHRHLYFSVVLLGCAALTHMGTAPMVASALAAQWIHGSPGTVARRMKSAWIVVLVAGFGLLSLVVGGGPLGQAMLLSSGDRPIEQPQLSAGQVVLWLGYGLVCYWLGRSIGKLIMTGHLKGRYAAVAALTSGPVAFVAIMSTYTLLLTGAPTLVIVIFARFLHLIIGVNLLILATRSRTFLPIGLASAFLAIDQARAIVEAVSVYFGADLLG
jgi:hypothetical protein